MSHIVSYRLTFPTLMVSWPCHVTVFHKVISRQINFFIFLHTCVRKFLDINVLNKNKTSFPQKNGINYVIHTNIEVSLLAMKLIRPAPLEVKDGQGS